MTSTTPAGSHRDHDAEEKLLKARQDAANALEALAQAEEGAHQYAAAREHLLQAADQETHVADEAKHLLEDVEATAAAEHEAANNGGTTSPRAGASQKAWVTGQPRK